jgi:hypothetical protein
MNPTVTGVSLPGLLHGTSSMAEEGSDPRIPLSMSLLEGLANARLQIGQNALDLLQRVTQVFRDLLGKDVGVRQVR